MEFFNEIWDIVVRYHKQLLSGLGYTMLIALVGTVIGLIIGLLTGVIRTAPKSRNVRSRRASRKSFSTAVVTSIMAVSQRSPKQRAKLA